MTINSNIPKQEFNELTVCTDIASDSSLYKTDIDSLPNEIIQYIFTFITNNDVRSIELVSKRWRVLSLTFPMNDDIIKHIQNAYTSCISSTFLKRIDSSTFFNIIKTKFPKDPISRRDYYLKLYNQNKDNYIFKHLLFVAFIKSAVLDEISYWAKLFGSIPSKELAQYFFTYRRESHYFDPHLEYHAIYDIKPKLMKYNFLKEIAIAKSNNLPLDNAFDLLALDSEDYYDCDCHYIIEKAFKLLFGKVEDHLIIDGIAKNPILAKKIITYLKEDFREYISYTSLRKILLYAKIAQKITIDTTIYNNLMLGVLYKTSMKKISIPPSQTRFILERCSKEFILEKLESISPLLDANLIKKIDSPSSLQLICKLPKREIRTLLVDQSNPIKLLLFFPSLNIYASSISILKEDFELLSIISQKLSDFYDAKVKFRFYSVDHDGALHLNNYTRHYDEVTKFLLKLKDIGIELSHNHNGVVFSHNLMECINKLKTKQRELDTMLEQFKTSKWSCFKAFKYIETDITDEELLSLKLL